MRPRTFDEFVGQEDLLAPGKPLREAIERDLLQSIILWGPPGTGKTTLARIIADTTRARFVSFSAVLAGIKEIRDVMAEAERVRRTTGRRTIVFIDEIHRFNKAQQDAFLPSRRGRRHRPHRRDDGEPVVRGERRAPLAIQGLRAARSDDRGGCGDPSARAYRHASAAWAPSRSRSTTMRLNAIALYSNGDARAALNLLELSLAAAPSIDLRRHVDVGRVEQTIQKRALLYDKTGEEHYNIISALHKSMRNSDPDAAVYWLARMVEAGEDPLYIARRLVRFASEDIGNADPQALTVAVAAKEAVHFIGMPEGNTALAQAAIYLATAPKSNAVYEAYARAAEDAHRDVAQPVPLHLRNAPTRLMKDLQYGKGYKYAHNEADAIADMSCLPSALEGRKYYQPTERGFEKELKRRLDGWEAIKKQRRS